MAATGDQIREALEEVFGVNGARLRGEGHTIKVDYFHGNENEDPSEWLTAFERASITNRWTTGERKKAIAGGHMKGTAADWFDGISATIGNHWATTTNDGNNFVDLFEARFINETKKNQWYQELAVLRQQSDESVDSYANKFKKLVNRIGMTDNVQKKRMFLMGLNPAYTPLVYSQNPADLDDAVNSARTIEIGYNFATGRVTKSDNSTPSVPSVVPKNVIANNEVDELTKRMEQLSLNYANLTTALLAQTQTPPRRRNFPNERNLNNERNFSGN
jgi:hypothetical protein